MSFKIHCFLYSVFITFSVFNYFVYSKVCTIRITAKNVSTITVKVSYEEQYVDMNCTADYDIEDCLKYRIAYKDKPVNVSKQYYTTKDICCRGYVVDESNNVTGSLKCKPVCKRFCENGYCSMPNVCTCREGYEKKKYFYGDRCRPVCSNGCQNGKCVAPDTCDCNEGYTFTNGTCEPVCSTPCNNSYCKAPDTCECLPGFRKNESDECKPYCSTGCDNGECIAPEVCRCNPGSYKFNNTLNVEICAPLCDEYCTDGEDCTSPGACACRDGYKKNHRNKCMPYCSECIYGLCVAPETCLCEEGWKLNEKRSDCVSLVNRGFLPWSNNRSITTQKTTTDFDYYSAFYPGDTGLSEDGNWTLELHQASMNAKKNNSQINYLVYILPVVSLLILVIVIMVIFRKRIYEYVKGKSYVVEGDPEHPPPDHLLNVQFSSIENKENNNET